MNDQDNIRSGDVVAPPKGPFWPRKDRERISQAVTALTNARIVRGAQDKVGISGRNLVIQLKDSTVSDPATPAASPSGIEQSDVVSEGLNFVNATRWSGETVEVQKPPDLRASFYTQFTALNPLVLADGYHSYDSNSINTRTDTVKNGTLTFAFAEKIWPPYVDLYGKGYGQLLVATHVTLADAERNKVEISYQDLNASGRKWYWLTNVCYQGGTYASYVDASKPMPLTRAQATQLQLQNLSQSSQTPVVSQFYTGAFSDPNAAQLLPADQSRGAMYYQDHGAIINTWLWSVENVNWFQTIEP